MSKTKMRCTTCGKWFQSANAKEVTCPDCVQKARREKLAARNTPPTSSKPTGPAGAGAPPRPAPPPKPRPVQGGTSHWFDTVHDVKVGQPDQPSRPRLPSTPAPRDNRSGPAGYRGPGGYREDRGPGGYREDRGPGGYREYEHRGPGGYREGGSRGPGAYREREYEQRGPGGYRVVGGSGLSSTLGQRPRQPMEGGPGRGPRPDRGPRSGGPREGGPTAQKPKAKPRPPAQPKLKREKTPPPAPFTPTQEQVAQIEARYIELAVPTEFDGIRTQISKELSIPKKAVKKIIKELRARKDIPSWWEIQTYKGSAEELERIKAAYEPLLPVPPVGVHKKIADELELKPGVVYQAIKAIRLEMNLPQYNDPALHGLDFGQPGADGSQPQAPASDGAGDTSATVSSETATETAEKAPEETIGSTVAAHDSDETAE